MTLPELVQRVKNLPNDIAADQVEKFVLELLGPDKRGQFMVTLFKRRVRAKLKRLK